MSPETDSAGVGGTRVVVGPWCMACSVVDVVVDVEVDEVEEVEVEEVEVEDVEVDVDVDVDVEVEVDVDVDVDVDGGVRTERKASAPAKLHVVVPVAAGGADDLPCADAMPVPTTATRPSASAVAATAEISLRDIPIPPKTPMCDECRQNGASGLILTRRPNNPQGDGRISCPDLTLR
jgi:hypothetical protein